jgi:hypothetical protein
LPRAQPKFPTKTKSHPLPFSAIFAGGREEEGRWRRMRRTGTASSRWCPRGLSTAAAPSGSASTGAAPGFAPPLPLPLSRVCILFQIGHRLSPLLVDYRVVVVLSYRKVVVGSGVCASNTASF